MDSSLKFQEQNKSTCLFDSSFFLKQTSLPEEFIWPDLLSAQQVLLAPVVDLEGVFKRDEEATQRAANIIRDACLRHGCFQVVNHGVDADLISDAQNHMDHFFMLPTCQKLKARRSPGSFSGYSGAHADRFSSRLPWKETLSLNYHENSSDLVVLDYFKSTLGKDFEQTGMVYQKYCEAMMDLSFVILELLAISLGVDRLHYRKFFEDGCSMLRCNFYPRCQQPSNVIGTAPHTDTTSITVLHQDQVGGLEVFTDNAWHTVPPRQGALVINIGDTFTALSNGKYKGCVHRAVVNKLQERKSLAFFLNPREDKVVTPPQDLVRAEGKRQYPDFTWSDLSRFVQNHYRANETTLQNFISWLHSSNQ